MITKEILQFVNAKLNSIIIYLVIIGLIFFILAVAILFFPAVIQYLFVIAFFAIAFGAFMIAVKVNNIKENFNQAMSLIGGRRRRK